MRGEPLVLVGTGRCGSTALHRLLGHHPDTSWFTGALDRWPALPSVNRALLAAIGLPGIGPLLRRRLSPGECYRFWERLLPGFRRPRRDLMAADLDPAGRERAERGLERALPPTRRPLLKVTGWPRIGLLGALFPAARFVHVLRDGRAVAASLLRVDFWKGREGPEHWRFGPLTADDEAAWLAADRSPTVLAGLQWKILTEAVRAARAELPAERFLEIRYEDLCAAPADTVDTILRFGGLTPSAAVDRALRARPFVDANPKWRRQLDSRERALLESVLRPTLRDRGYV